MCIVKSKLSKFPPFCKKPVEIDWCQSKRVIAIKLRCPAREAFNLMRRMLWSRSYQPKLHAQLLQSSERSKKGPAKQSINQSSKQAMKTNHQSCAAVNSDLLQNSWPRAWRSLGLPPAPGLDVQLIEAYRQPQRHYHTLQHLLECLMQWETVMQLTQFPGELELALWFHDAVYHVKGKDNEAQSARWATKAMSEQGASAEQIRRVQGLIMATCHSAAPSQPDQQLLVDIDLAILGAEGTRFAEYDAQVAAEYSWVPSWIYRAKRKQVLRSFLARDFIYSTPHFRCLLEAQARINLSGLNHGAAV